MGGPRRNEAQERVGACKKRRRRVRLIIIIITVHDRAPNLRETARRAKALLAQRAGERLVGEQHSPVLLQDEAAQRRKGVGGAGGIDEVHEQRGQQVA